MEKAKASFARHPTLHYCLLMSLGAFGVWVSMPLFFRPQSTLEWMDWTINLFIFIPSSFIVVVSGLLAIFSAVFAYRPDENGRFAALAHTILTAFGLPRLSLRELAAQSPVGLLGTILSGNYSGRANDPTADG